MRKEKPMFIDDVKRIARTCKDERRRAIMGMLQERDVPFCVQRLLEGEHWVENIVISFAPSNRRLVIGAHYDNLEGSSGANDNAIGLQGCRGNESGFCNTKSLLREALKNA